MFLRLCLRIWLFALMKTRTGVKLNRISSAISIIELKMIISVNIILRSSTTEFFPDITFYSVY